MRLSDGREIAFNELKQAVIEFYKKKGRDVLRESELRRFIMEKYKVSKEEANSICFMLSWTPAILGYIPGRIVRYRLLSEEERQLEEEMAWYEERGLPTRSDLEVELKIAIERGELPPSIDAKVVAGKLWNIFYERGKEVPKTTVTKLLAKKASITIEQAKQVLKALENHDVVVTRGRRYVITTPYERVRLSRGYH
ncbi:MAG: hypothetical protein QXO97_00465 [Candidatus Nezhaarchaeales archaeon]